MDFDNIRAYAKSSEAEKYMLDKLSQIVSIPSIISDPEMKQEALSTFLEFAKQEGFEVEAHNDWGSVLINNCETEIGIFAHLDVVPAGKDWKYNPFILTQKDGLLIGRGTLDDKGPAVAALCAMKYFVDRSVALPFSIRLFLGCNEESGMSDIENFLSTHKAPDFSFTPDNAFPICCGENGIATIMVSSEIGEDIDSVIGRTVVNSSSSYAKATFVTKLPVSLDSNTGDPCIHLHKKDVEVVNLTNVKDKPFNAILTLCKYLHDKEWLTETSRKAIELVLVLSSIGWIENEATHDKLSMPDYLSVRCDSIRVKDRKLISKYLIRYSALNKLENIIAHVEENITPYNSKIKILTNRSGVIYNVDKRKIECLLNAYYEATGIKGKPFFDNYGTYATALPNTVGFGARATACHSLLGNGRGNMHEKDEYISLTEMKTALETYIRAIFNLSKLYIQEE